jgi:hypothetical protein
MPSSPGYWPGAVPCRNTGQPSRFTNAIANVGAAVNSVGQSQLQLTRQLPANESLAPSEEP